MIVKVWILVTAMQFGVTSNNFDVKESLAKCQADGWAYVKAHERRLMKAQFVCQPVTISVPVAQ